MSNTSWAKLDDGFWMNPKIIQAGNVGAGIFSRLLSYCARYDVDRVHDDVLRLVSAGDQHTIQTLTDAGALVKEPDGLFRLDPAPQFVAAPNTRRMLEQRAPGWASRDAKQARIDFYGGRCWICRIAPYAAMDHVKPISRGGSNWPANLRPVCKPCNSRKSAQWPYEVQRVQA